MTDKIKSIQTFLIEIPRDVPYLGATRTGEAPNSKGYIVRKDNRTIYPINDKSMLVKITTEDGRTGWGETYGICAPKVVKELVSDIIEPCLLGRDPLDVQIIWEDLYDLMRVRGYQGGFYLDAIAGVDIGLWDICGKISNLPLNKLLGGARHHRLPAYVSGLARPTIEERVALAKDWYEKGFRAFKIHAVMSATTIVDDMRALREALGPDADLMVDLHWMFNSAEALSLIEQLKPYNLKLIEAPCKPEDVDGLSRIAQGSSIPIAAGEEWRTVHDARSRLQSGAVSIVQPEMGHTGITQFVRIGQMAQSYHARIMPHATIGLGIFMAASLHAASSLLDVPYHEYQPTIFDRNAQFLSGELRCLNGFYEIPGGPGLGVEPLETVWKYQVE